jgi:hypothetical protein
MSLHTAQRQSTLQQTAPCWQATQGDITTMTEGGRVKTRKSRKEEDWESKISLPEFCARCANSGRCMTRCVACDGSGLVLCFLPPDETGYCREINNGKDAPPCAMCSGTGIYQWPCSCPLGKRWVEANT